MKSILLFCLHLFGVHIGNSIAGDAKANFKFSNQDNRQLFIFGTSEVTVNRPNNDSVVSGNSIDVEITYGNDSLFGLFKRLTKLEVFIGDDLVAERSSFLGLPILSGTDTFTIDISTLSDGQYKIQAIGSIGLRIFGRKVESEEILINVDRRPQVVKDFTTATFIPGLTNDFENTTEFHQGEDYLIFANFTTIETGIVSLAESKSLLQSVSCRENGTVVITFRQDVPLKYLSSMFPAQAMLLIDGESLGSCYLGFDEDETNSTYWTDRAVNSTEDGYLIIEMVMIVQGTTNAVEVRGSRSSFLLMFDEAELMIEPVDENITDVDFINPNSTDRGRELFDTKYDLKKVMPDPKDKPNALIRLTTGVIFRVLVRCKINIKYKFLRGLTLSMTFEYELGITPYTTVELKFGKQTDDYVSPPLAEYPVWAIPNIKILKALKISQPKTGVFLELSLFNKWIVDTDAIAKFDARTSLTSGRKKYEYYVTLSVRDGLDAGTKTLRNDKARSGPLEITTILPGAFTATATIFTGVQPGIFAYILNLAKVGISQRSGLEFQAAATSKGFPALTGGKGIVVGPCSSCHSFRVLGDAVVENISFEYRFGFKVKFFFWKFEREKEDKYTLPGAIRFDLLTACADKRNDLIACADKCCVSGYKCVSGQCRELDVTEVARPIIVPDYFCSTTSLAISLENAQQIPTRLFVPYYTADEPFCSSRTSIIISDVSRNRTIASYCNDVRGIVPTYFVISAFNVSLVRLQLHDRLLDERYNSRATSVSRTCVF